MNQIQLLSDLHFLLLRFLTSFSPDHLILLPFKPAFASWHLQVIKMLVEGPRLEAFVSVFLGICVAFCGLALGRDIGDLVIYVVNRKQRSSFDNVAQRSGSPIEEPSTPNSVVGCTFSVLLFVFVDLYAAVLVGAVIDNENFSTRDRGFLWICGAFAPYGAWLRWWLSRFNSVKENLFLGTFAANMAAMVLDLAVVAALRTHVNSNMSQKTEFVLLALISGLGGSLSTVSTWISESSRLRRPWRYVNLIGTSAAAILLGIMIYGATYWAT